MRFVCDPASLGNGTIKRVAMISVHTCPLATLGGKETGGMNVYVRDLSRELDRHGVQVDAFTRSQNPHLPHVMHRLGLRGKVVHIPTGPEEPYDKKLIYNHLDEFTQGVLDSARREGATYDVIHSHYWLSGLVAERLRQAWGVPVVHMFHTLAHMKNTIAQSEAEREPELRLQMEEHVVSQADRLVAATPVEQDQLLRFYGADPARIAIIPPGVDILRFHPIQPEMAKEAVGVPLDRRMVLFVGRIEPLKGVDTLLRAIALCGHACPDWVSCLWVAIIGGNPDANDNAEMERLKTLRQELGIGDVVTFLGAREQDTLQYYYSAADVVVVPSHYESFGMVALEAMACGAPVVASDVGG
ncbi:MAG: glycosyltransferase, partial [Thermoflexales bacterium]|nr:glycosyltransferase [Thermoflexales bacterium]